MNWTPEAIVSAKEASPELYEALEMVVEELLELDAMPIPSGVYRKALVALAKARGEV